MRKGWQSRTPVPVKGEGPVFREELPQKPVALDLRPSSSSKQTRPSTGSGSKHPLTEQSASKGKQSYALKIRNWNLFAKLKTAKLKIKKVPKALVRRDIITRYSLPVLAGLVIFGIGLGWTYHHRQYSFNKNELSLLGKPSVDVSKIKETADAFEYNHADETKPADKGSITEAASPADASGEFPYQATLPKKASDGVSFADAEGQLSFKLIPLDGQGTGDLQDGRVVYPQGLTTKQVYTFKRNGLKEDIVLSSAPGKTASWRWSLELGDKLEAKMLPDGGVGLYSASPYLYGNLQVSDAQSQALVDKAKTADKSYLAFELPAPYIKDAKGLENREDTGFKLDGNTLTLEARNLNNKHYPLSVDPSVVVTTTADFRGGNDDGMVDYGTADQVGRSAVSLGATASFTTNTTYFSFIRWRHTSVAYNGYLYVIGGDQATSDTNCKNTGVAENDCNDVQYAAINPNGSIGAFTTSSNYFSFPRLGHTSVAYNGYLYVIGGAQTPSNTNCKNTGSTSVYCNDVQYAAINPNGSIGAFTTNTTYFSFTRYGHTSVAYNGYLYVIGGLQGGLDTNCKNTGSASNYCNDVQYAAINADGSVGAFTNNTNYFSLPRRNHTSVAYNGYLYVIGGYNNGTYYSDVQYAAINADGSVGAFTTNSNSMSFPRDSMTSVAYNGYLYVIGGEKSTSDTNCRNTGTSSDACNDVLYAPINANGSIGTFTTNTNYFSAPRKNPTSIAYNGYLYVVGGRKDASNTNCQNIGTAIWCNDVQYAAINTGTPNFGSTSGSSTQTLNAFTTFRTKHASVAYNGYLYVVGGNGATSGTGCDANNYCGDIQYSKINTDGSLSCPSGRTCPAGTVFYQQLSALYDPRRSAPVVAYNGSLYVIGGSGPTANSAVGCTVAARCTDIQRCVLSADGSVGDGISGNVNCTQQLSRFGPGRNSHAAVVYQGYIYITGGKSDPSASTECDANGNCKDIQYCQIASNGSVNACTLSGVTFTTNRNSHGSVVYNGYLYVIGGLTGTGTPSGCDAIGLCDDVNRCAIASNHTITSCVQQTSILPSKRWSPGSVAYNGYLYTIGGCTAGTLTCNGFATDVQYCQINSGGDIGTCSSSSVLSIGRAAFGTAAYNGYFYTTGGNQATSTPAITGCDTIGRCNDVMYAAMKSPAQAGHYERTIDTGHDVDSLDSLQYNGATNCGADVQYAASSSSGSFGSLQTLSADAVPGTTYSLSGLTVKRYLRVVVTLDDQACGGASNITDVTLSYTVNPPPAPTLSSPANGATGVSVQPSLKFSSTDVAGDDLKYWVDICSTSNCSTVLQSICQTGAVSGSPTGTCTPSQAGWSAQSQQTGTAYSSGQQAVYTPPTPLNPSTTYYWRAYAIDPGGSNTWSGASTISSFQTQAATPNSVNISPKGGDINIYSGVTIGQ